MRRAFVMATLFAFIMGACFTAIDPFSKPLLSTRVSFLGAAPSGAARNGCTLVNGGYGLGGTVSVRAEQVVAGLEVPWGIMFLGNRDMLVTERAGRLRLVRDGRLVPKPVAELAISATGEGGLLGIVPHPEFADNRLFYLYYTAEVRGRSVNRVERWRLSTNAASAAAERTTVANIPAARYHNGGRLRFGPDGMLYIGTGDARQPRLAQDPESMAGKVLRVTHDGQVPQDNPFQGQPAFVIGIRNTQGFDWHNETILWLTDHGPTGEMGRTGHDEVNVASAGANLGWPPIYGCENAENMLAPVLTWDEAVPPGGAAIYTGDRIPEWQGSLLIGSLDSEHLHRIIFDPANPRQLQTHEVYFQNELGRLREVIMGPDGDLYVTTSNCDGRGQCPPEKDKILRITR